MTVHKFEETSSKLYLVTERLVQSLNIFSHDKDKSYLKYLTSHIFDALEFIHGPAKLFHGNINNEHFYVTNSGIAKIAGFELSKEISNSSVPSDFRKIQQSLTLKGTYHQGNSLPKQDLYALGGEIAKIFSGDVGKDLGKRTLCGVPFYFESDFSPKLDHDLRNLCKSLFSGSFVRLSKDSSLSIIEREINIGKNGLNEVTCFMTAFRNLEFCLLVIRQESIVETSVKFKLATFCDKMINERETLILDILLPICFKLDIFCEIFVSQNNCFHAFHD